MSLPLLSSPRGDPGPPQLSTLRMHRRSEVPGQRHTLTTASTAPPGLKSLPLPSLPRAVLPYHGTANWKSRVLVQLLMHDPTFALLFFSAIYWPQLGRMRVGLCASLFSRGRQFTYSKAFRVLSLSLALALNSRGAHFF
jgi:hypothetical protein